MSIIPATITEQATQARQIVVPAPTIAGLGDEQWLADSLALTTDQDTPVPYMVRPFLPHQAAAHVAVEARIDRFGCALLGDDMGLGKTQTMLASIARRVENGPALVIAPPVTRHGWQGDVRAAFPNLRIAFLQGRTRKDIPQADVLFINDDPLTMKAWLVDVSRVNEKDVFAASPIVRQASIIVRDEIHRDKGNQTKPGTRTKVMLALGAYARSAGIPIIGSTGTLLTNRPVEAFFPLQILGGDDMLRTVTPGSNSNYGFLYRYCAPVKVNAGRGRQATDFGGMDVEEAQKLHDYLRRSLYVRREKADLGDDLPHAGWTVLPLSIQEGEVMRRYRRLEKEFLTIMEEENGPAAMWRMARAEAIVKMNKLWEEAGVAKAEAAAEYIVDLVNDGEPVVAFYIHNRVRDELVKHLDKAGLSHDSINGKVKGEARQDVIETFQQNGTDVVLVQIKAGGMGVTLTAASNAVFVQVPWSAGDLKQAADRIYRVDARTYAKAESGQAITWHVLQAAYADGTPTFDSAIWSVLEVKARVCDAVNAGQEVTMPEESVQRQAMESWYRSASQSDKFKLSW